MPVAECSPLYIPARSYGYHFPSISKLPPSHEFGAGPVDLLMIIEPDLILVSFFHLFQQDGNLPAHFIQAIESFWRQLPGFTLPVMIDETESVWPGAGLPPFFRFLLCMEAEFLFTSSTFPVSRSKTSFHSLASFGIGFAVLDQELRIYFPWVQVLVDQGI